MKFQFIGTIAGTPHPTGYPLFIIITSIFSRIPFQIPLYSKINLVSTIFAILTLFLLLKIIELLTSSLFSAAISTSIFAFGKIFWSQATEAEVYTLNSFFTSLTIYLLILWTKSKEEKFLSLSIFTLILGLSNHITISLLTPSLLLFILTNSPEGLFKRRTILISILALLLLFSLYLFLVWRSNNSLYSEFQIKSIKDFFYFMSGAHWGEKLNFSFEIFLSNFLQKFIPTVNSNFTFPILIISITGMIYLIRDLKIFLLLFLSFTAFLFFSSVYSIRDIEPYYIQVYLFGAIFSGMGLKFIFKIKISRVFRLFLILALVIIPIFLLLSNFKEMKVEESYWGEWIKIVFRTFKSDTVFVPDYINYDQDMALCYGIFGLGFIKNNIFVIGGNLNPSERERILNEYLKGKDVSSGNFKLKKGMKVIYFDENLAFRFSSRFKVERREISEKIKIEYFRIYPN
ncbi:MAG: protein O-mannosyl-transferase family [Candidatus Aminicenantia bacterium]